MIPPRNPLLVGLLLAHLGVGLVVSGCGHQGPGEVTPEAGTPADHGMALPVARPIADSATLETSDPPPYDRATRLHSDMSLVIGERTLRPNLHFDFESSGDTSLISREVAFSGISSQVIRAGKEFAPAIRRLAADVADTLASVAVGLWLHTAAERSPITIVVSLDRNDEQLAWFGREIQPREHEPNRWQPLRAEFHMGDLLVSGEDLVSVYIWNRDTQLVYIDDMDVVYRSTRMPGRRSGTAFDLERPAQGTRPFARVAFHAHAGPDSAQHPLAHENFYGSWERPTEGFRLTPPTDGRA